MGKLNIISGRRLINLLEQFGWIVARRKGSHIVMVKPGENVSLSIPDHDEIAKGTLRSLLRSAGITVEEYNNALSKK